MPTEPLSHRERVRLALEHQVTDRIPMAMVCSGINRPAAEALGELLQRTRGVTVEQYLRPLIDIRGVGPQYVGPPLASGQDCWGVVRSAVSYGQGFYDEITHHPLGSAASIDELARHAWPSPDWFDYSILPERIARVDADGGPYCIIALNCNVFETSWYMRGFEQAFADLGENPELFDHILERVGDFFVEHARRTLAAARGRIDLIFTADDIAGQSGLLMSLDMWRRHIFPHHARINRVIHEHGARVIYHSDGAVTAAVPALREMGIDILQALQFDADGMDPAALKREHGEGLCFEGGVSVQRTLPFGTPEQVRQETLQRIAILGKGGGYILGPSHTIQAGTPPENVLAMFEAARAAPMTG